MIIWSGVRTKVEQFIIYPLWRRSSSVVLAILSLLSVGIEGVYNLVRLLTARQEDNRRMYCRISGDERHTD
jgi:hypothetical protein